MLIRSYLALSKVWPSLWQNLEFFRNRIHGNMRHRSDVEFLELWRLAKQEGRAGATWRELHNLYTFAKSCSRLEGDWAELGVFRGGTAKTLTRLLPEGKELHLFDSFAGMPETLAFETHKAGDFKDTSLADVQAFVNHPRAVYHPGFVPQTLAAVTNRTFSFVHLDLDLYEATLGSLEFFYDRLASGGVILSHDYQSITTPGVPRAFHEFAAARGLRVLPLFDTQAILVKA